MREGDDELLDVDGIVEDDSFAGAPAPALAMEGRLRGVAPGRTVLPIVAQAAALATAGFAAGALTAVVVRAARRGTIGPRRAARGLPRTHVVATRSFLIDVHVLETRER